MLLCKRIHRLDSHLVAHFRLYSSHSVSPYFFQNIRAFPFKLSPHDAQRHLSPFAAGIRHEKILQSIASRLFPGLGFKPIEPLRLTPVYFPGWILDAEVKGEVTLKGDDRQASVQIHNVYIPGSDYKVLSSAPLAPVNPHLRETVPFSENLLRPFDLDVICIPYNISPFKILDLVQHLSYPETTMARNFRFTPSSLKPNLLAAYPILIPLYLAQYEHDTGTGKQLHTLFTEAWGAHGNIWSEPFGSHHALELAMLDRVKTFLGKMYHESNDVVVNLGYPKRFVDTVGVSLTPHQELGRAIREYLENALYLPSTPTALAAASVNDLDSLAEDKRVREFSIEERKPIITWLKLGAELMKTEQMHETMLKARQEAQTLGIGAGAKGHDGKAFQIVENAIQQLVEKSTNLHKARRAIKPTWAMSEEDLLEEKSEAGKSEATDNKTEKDSEP